MTTLSNRAMLVSLNVSQWTARKQDKRASREVTEAHGAESGSARVHKDLIDRRALKAIQTAAGDARTYHYQHTLAWQHDGAQILSADLFPDYMSAMRAFRERFETAVREFLDRYELERERQRVTLNGLFREDDYPTRATLAGRYAFAVNVSPLPDAADFRVQLGDDAEREIKDQITARMEAAQHTAMRDLWSRVHDVVSAMHERLSEPDRIFRDSLVGNLRALVDLLPGLNIAGDPELERMRERLAERLAKNEPETLRNSPAARQAAADEAASILDAMAGYIGG